MIDVHVHLRDWKQRYKESVLHGLSVAYQAGYDGVIEKCNTDPALTSEEPIEGRIKLGDEAIERLNARIFHGIVAGITPEESQIKEVIESYRKYFPRVVALKMFCADSTGNMGITEKVQQAFVYRKLVEEDFRGALELHCEKEELMRKGLWDYKNPFSHTLARPPESETESVKDQIELAYESGFKGTLHFLHLSVPESYDIIENARKNNSLKFKLSCEVSPNHAILYDELMKKDNGNLLKMNPPLRPKEMQKGMLDLILKNQIDIIATDHAPHTLYEKLSDNPPSGIPGIPYLPRFLKLLGEKGMSEDNIDDISHNNILKIYGIPSEAIPNTKRWKSLSKDELEHLSVHYDYNPFRFLDLEELKI